MGPLIGRGCQQMLVGGLKRWVPVDRPFLGAGTQNPTTERTVKDQQLLSSRSLPPRSLMATEMQKAMDKEFPKKALETTPHKPSLTERLDESPNLSTQSSLEPVTEGPRKEGQESKESESPSAEAPLVSSSADSVTDLQKRIRRAERFGMSVQLSEEEKRNSRAERFGTGSTLHGSDGSNKLEEQKRKARAERFGLPAQSMTDEEVKKKARSDRFAPVSKTNTVEEDKKKARAIRFSQTPSAAPSQVNGKANPDQETAIMGKASGET